MHHPHVRHCCRRTILLRKMREQIPWANFLKLEIAGAYRMASMNRTGKYGSHSSSERVRYFTERVRNVSSD